MQMAEELLTGLGQQRLFENSILGHPARAAGLARLLDYVTGLDDVWVCRRADIARHWLAHHPAS